MNAKIQSHRSGTRQTLAVITAATAVAAALLAGCSGSERESEPAAKPTEIAQGSALARQDFPAPVSNPVSAARPRSKQLRPP